MGSTVGVPSHTSLLYQQQGAEIESFGRKVTVSKRTTVPLDLQVAHFTPSTFPLVPMMRPEFMPECRKAWIKIVAQRERIEEYGTDIHGITLFYNEFYERLSKVDSMGLYESILMRNAVGTNKIAAKGAILVRIVDFILKLDGDTPDSRAKLRRQGEIHKALGIRPWQYSVFLEIFVHTLSHRLQQDATPEVMEAWVNVLGYTLQKMLPSAIDGIVLESDAHTNFFRSDIDANHLNKTKDMKQIYNLDRSNVRTKSSLTERSIMTTATEEEGRSVYGAASDHHLETTPIAEVDDTNNNNNNNNAMEQPAAASSTTNSSSDQQVVQASSSQEQFSTI